MLSTGHRLRLELLRTTALDELPTLDLNAPEQCRLSATLVFAIMAINRVLKEDKDKGPRNHDWQR